MGRDGNREHWKITAEADNRPVCGDDAARDLNLILSGRFGEAMPEYAGLLLEKGKQVPPELLPELLDRAARYTHMAAQLMAIAGSRGAWLARQHPRWADLAEKKGADWFTGSFPERKLLLQETRSRNPLLALTWLEKTWKEEKPAHKLQFIELLRIRLSPADEPLLMRALQDKNRDIRIAALEILLRLPDSETRAQALSFFRERLSDAILPARREKVLKKNLPDMSEGGLQRWMSMPVITGKSDWREALFLFFISILPPGDLLAQSGLTKEAIVAAFDNAADAEQLLESLVRHTDATWTDAVLGHFCTNWRHVIWQSKAMTDFITAFAPDAIDIFDRTGAGIGFENECVLRALEHYDRPWTRTMVVFLLDQYRRAAFSFQSEIPGWHFAPALRTAAYHCQPADALATEVARAYFQSQYPSRPREFLTFLDIIRFRQGMRQHIA